jgi:tetratricopeptide (TPR) repeat protein
MEYTRIIQETAQKLTGESQHDLSLLKSAMAEHARHPNAIEICRGIGRMIFTALPEEDKKQFNQFFENAETARQTLFEMAHERLREKDIDGAEAAIRLCIPDDNRFREDEASIYFHFNEMIEEIYYRFRFKPSKDLRVHPEVNLKAFLTYAYILVEKKDFNTALRILMEGLRYNPLDTGLLFEMGEICKFRKDWKVYRKITERCFEYAHTSIALARAYRNFGYMLIEMKDWDGAICCYLMSRHYDPKDNMAASQLYFISQVTGSGIDESHYDENLQNMLESRRIPLGPCQEMVAVAYRMGNLSLDEKQVESALYFFGICFDLTRNEQIAELIAKLKSVS